MGAVRKQGEWVIPRDQWAQWGVHTAITMFTYSSILWNRWALCMYVHSVWLWVVWNMILLTQHSSICTCSVDNYGHEATPYVVCLLWETGIGNWVRIFGELFYICRLGLAQLEQLDTADIMTLSCLVNYVDVMNNDICIFVHKGLCNKAIIVCIIKINCLYRTMCVNCARQTIKQFNYTQDSSFFLGIIELSWVWNCVMGLKQ